MMRWQRCRLYLLVNTISWANKKRGFILTGAVYSWGGTGRGDGHGTLEWKGWRWRSGRRRRPETDLAEQRPWTDGWRAGDTTS
ncbi:hypothetical protein E2562_027920 [Oryza meyeriana var. granulata]|uniref:Uncharacterized protein n=1 Tax=Oryza meyeriana var. granulata TaxID=110450 RepID=A0A6G1EZS7_9ORYZ|nr:hypothetical protein E2562_027920 [Oryza meyeriana var. granulata]